MRNLLNKQNPVGPPPPQEQEQEQEQELHDIDIDIDIENFHVLADAQFETYAWRLRFTVKHVYPAYVGSLALLVYAIYAQWPLGAGIAVGLLAGVCFVAVHSLPRARPVVVSDMVQREAPYEQHWGGKRRE
ncbi:hypothetical protein GGR53DRAFT_398272 [Hypoxylon sp. FL1150]|nr:hypothetical protein GGR53DRAFT_398272 [Hypoxylon sp. FL1150]